MIRYWTRDLFDAVERRDATTLLAQVLKFLPLAAATVALAVAAVYGRMTLQRTWRAFLVADLVGRWVDRGHYYQLNLVKGDHQVPEGRIADDARIATDAPVDLLVGLFQSVVGAITFIGILWIVGGDLRTTLFGTTVRIPGYLVIAVVAYSAVVTGVMMLFARRFSAVSEAVNQAEAEFRYALTHVRENGESVALLGEEAEERNGLGRALQIVIGRWRSYCRQHMRSAFVSSGNSLIAPVVPLFLCMPKFLAGDLTLGEVTQAAAAFVLVQSAFNWLVDNFPRVSDWTASARRVGSLMTSLDRLESLQRPGALGTIARTVQDDAALRFRNLTVRLDDGTVVIKDADAVIAPGERVLLLGESGTGKTTLVRAIAGLWPWGSGEISMRRDAKTFLMTQRPYIPLGTLRRVATYPHPAEEVPNEKLRELMRLAGIAHLVERLDVVEPWDQVLSSGEKQRIAFVRLFLHRPDIIVMDEAMAALDSSSQGMLMQLVATRLPDATVLSISYRPELEALHDRRLLFEHRPGGSRLISEERARPAA